jgi:hypothetical protein
MRAVSHSVSALRHGLGAGLEGLLVAVLLAALLLALAPVSDDARRLADTGNAYAGRADRYPGTLRATPDRLQAGDMFTVSGCGYDTKLGNVKIAFTGGSWGSALDEDGCFTITHIPALSGDTLPAGTYEVSAYQYLHKKWVKTGDTTVTVVP